MSEPVAHLFRSLRPSADTLRRSCNVKRWPSAATYFVIHHCHIAEKPRAVYRFPFSFLIT